MNVTKDMCDKVHPVRGVDEINDYVMTYVNEYKAKNNDTVPKKHWACKVHLNPSQTAATEEMI